MGFLPALEMTRAWVVLGGWRERATVRIPRANLRHPNIQNYCSIVYLV